MSRRRLAHGDIGKAPIEAVIALRSACADLAIDNDDQAIPNWRKSV